MIINLWSTPRTGSVWYSHHLASTNQPSILLTEPFNRFHMNMYYMISHNNTITNHHQYTDGSFYKEYYLQENRLLTRRMYGKRQRTVEEEEQYLSSLFTKLGADTDVNYIVHNHVEPMSKHIRDFLMTIGQNVFIYRKDKFAQLASYAIAYETKEFARFNKSNIVRNNIEMQDLQPLIDLINRIKVWDSIDKKYSIAYEDIKFYETPGMPLKQNGDHSKILSEKTVLDIKQLLQTYYPSFNTSN